MQWVLVIISVAHGLLALDASVGKPKPSFFALVFLPKPFFARNAYQGYMATYIYYGRHTRHDEITVFWRAMKGFARSSGVF